MRKIIAVTVLFAFIFAAMLGLAHAQADPCDFDRDGDVDGSDLAGLAAGAPGCGLAEFAGKFGTLYDMGEHPCESDDFNQNNLDSRWTFVNPVGDGYAAITGVGQDAHLELNVPSGPSHDPWDYNESVRVMQPAADTDFDVTVKFDSIPSLALQMQGLIVEQDSANWIRFGNYSDGEYLILFAAITTQNSSQDVLTEYVTVSGSSIYLRVQRSGDNWSYSYSEDGVIWTLAGSFQVPLTVTKIGIYGANHGDPSPAYTARVDYFEEASDPIPWEDGWERPDDMAPFLHTVSFLLEEDGYTVHWFTDEPAYGAVEYGLDSGYGSTVFEAGGPSYEHAVQIAGLQQYQTYHFRISSEDPGDRISLSEDFELTFRPVIDVWYGGTQTFGNLGQPQPYVNIVGNVAPPGGLSDLYHFYYTLNGGGLVDLSIGPDFRRLERAGDFNIDLATADLVNGVNTVVITAVETGHIREETVTVNYTSGTVWPLPYAIDWSTLVADADIQTVAQVVDGKWKLANGGIRTAEPGYDRLVAVGDRTWQYYEVVAPITLHAAQSGSGWGVGFLIRWDGHTDDPVVCDQPKCGWEPMGDLGWLTEDGLNMYHQGTDPRTWSLETVYMLKMRVEDSGSDTVYKVKAWDPAVEAEPDWQVTRTVSDTLTPAAGSILLLSHMADATFGNVSIVPVSGP